MAPLELAIEVTPRARVDVIDVRARAALTGLNASSLTSGTLADQRLSSSVALRTTSQTFTGANTFGNAPRTITDVRTPTQKNVDIAVSKNIRLGGGRFAQVKVEVVNLLNREILSVLQSSDARDRLLKGGFEVAGTSPQEFAAFIRRDMATTGKVIRASGMRTD